MQRLSSSLTIISRVIFFLVLGDGCYWLTREPRAGRSGIIFIFIWCVIWGVITFRWKNVYHDGGNLYVSHYLKRVAIPLSEVNDVEASSWWGWQPRTVTVSLRTPAAFGESFVFVPRDAGMRADRTASELRSLVAARR